MGIIEIKSRDVQGTSILPENLTPQHTFYIYTNDRGEKQILRGGPEGSDLKGTFFGDVEVQDIKYDKSSINWDENNSHPSAQIFSGTDSEMLAKISKAREEMARLNKEHL